MIYVDTNVLIAYINPKDKLHENAKALLTRYSRDKLVISQITILELYSVFSRVMSISDVELEALVNYTVKKCNVETITIDWDELYSRSLNYANKLKLKTLDLLHVITAYLVGVKTLISFDKDIASKNDLIRSLLGMEVISL